MPNENEYREEDAGAKEPWAVSLLRQIQNPDDEYLPANTQLPYTMATPMAELATIEQVWGGLIRHQIAKAKLYKLTLGAEKQSAYQTRIDTFIAEHFVQAKDGGYDLNRPKLASTALRKYISLYSLSVLGKHIGDIKEIGKAMIESSNVAGDINSTPT